MAPSGDLSPRGPGVFGLPGDAGRHDLQHVDFPGSDCGFGHRILRGVSATMPQIAAQKLLVDSSKLKITPILQLEWILLGQVLSRRDLRFSPGFILSLILADTSNPLK